MVKKLTREDAWALLTEYTETVALRRHALTVEAVMRHFARLAGEDEDIWGAAGLLHACASLNLGRLFHRLPFHKHDNGAPC